MIRTICVSFQEKSQFYYEQIISKVTALQLGTSFTTLILRANTFLIAYYVAGMALSISHILAHLILMIIQCGKAIVGSLLQFRKLRHRELLPKVELGFEPQQPSSRACAFNCYAK